MQTARDLLVLSDTMRLLPALSLVLVAALTTACGGASEADGGGGSSGTGGGAGGSGGSGSGGAFGKTCGDFKNAALGPELTVQFENTTATALYVLPKNFGCGEEVLFRLHDSNQDEWLLEPGDCGTTCESLKTGPVDCAAACQAPRVLRLEPGSSFDYKWSGAVYQQTECYREAPPGTASCRYRITPVASSHTISAEATSDCGGCSCDTVTGNGFCNTFDQLTAETTAKAAISFPSAASVKVTFQ